MEKKVLTLAAVLAETRRRQMRIDAFLKVCRACSKTYHSRRCLDG
jgi:hypothetical protein